MAAEADRVAEAASGSDRSLFSALVERHSRFVYRIALAVTRNPQDAEDVAQETFLELFRGGRWRQMTDERAYLARMTWRLAAHGRGARARGEELSADLASASAGPEQTAIDRNMERRLHALIDQLPEKLRQPLALAALGDLTLVEVARALGLPEGTVRRRIHTARQKLKQQLIEMEGGKG